MFRKMPTQTYRRRSKQERMQVQKKLEAAEEEKLAADRALRATRIREALVQKNVPITQQLLLRELTGRGTASWARQPQSSSPVDSLLSLYDKKLSGPCLSRLSVLTKVDKRIEHDLYNGDLVLLGFPQRKPGSNSLSMLGYRVCEHDENEEVQWSGEGWQKSIELYWMRITFQSISYSVPLPVQPASSKSNRPLIATKSIALARMEERIRCCAIPLDVHSLCIHQTADRLISMPSDRLRGRG